MDKLRNIFIVLAVASGAAWILKVAAIAAQGGAETEGGIISVLWALGMLTFHLAAATGAALLLARAHVSVRVLAGVVAVALAWTLLMVLDGVTDAAMPSGGWFRDEVSLLIAGVLMASVGVRVLARGRLDSRPETSRPGREATRVG